MMTSLRCGDIRSIWKPLSFFNFSSVFYFFYGMAVEKLKCEMEGKENEKGIKNNVRSIKRQIKQYRFLLQKNQDSEASTSLNKYTSIEGADPITILKIKERVIKDEMKMLSILFRIYIRYITLLNLTGVLPENPDENHLLGKTAK